MVIRVCCETYNACIPGGGGGGGGGGSDDCAMCKNIAYYRMRMGIIGDQFAHSVTDDLNIYYKQFPCVGTPKFKFHIERISLK